VERGNKIPFSFPAYYLSRVDALYISAKDVQCPVLVYNIEKK